MCMLSLLTSFTLTCELLHFQSTSTNGKEGYGCFHPAAFFLLVLPQSFFPSVNLKKCHSILGFKVYL